jgi:biopolymer transport protein ExbD
MRKALARARRDETRIDLTPMIDVVFQIVIFFLCTLQYRTLEGRLDAFLPRDTGRAASDASKEERLEVRVDVLDPGERRSVLDPARPWDGRGPFELVGRRLDVRVGPRHVSGVHALDTLLQELHRLFPEREVALSPGPGTVTQDVVTVLDRLLEAGFHAVAVAAERPAPGGR